MTKWVAGPSGPATEPFCFCGLLWALTPDGGAGELVIGPAGVSWALKVRLWALL